MGVPCQLFSKHIVLCLQLGKKVQQKATVPIKSLQIFPFYCKEILKSWKVQNEWIVYSCEQPDTNIRLQRNPAVLLILN